MTKYRLAGASIVKVIIRKVLLTPTGMRNKCYEDVCDDKHYWADELYNSPEEVLASIRVYE